MSVKRDRDRWVVQFSQGGERVHRRCPQGATKAEAVALETRLRRELFAVGELGAEPSVPLPTCIAEWLRERVTGSKSQRSRELHAFALVDYVEGKTLRDIPAIADAYREDAIASGLARATVNNRLCILKAVAKWAWRKEPPLIRENLSAKVWLYDPQNARHRYESMDTIRALIRAMQTADGRAWVALAAGTGMRASELHRLQRNQVVGDMVSLGVTKNGEPRIVPAAAWALPYLSAIPFKLSRDQLDQEWRAARTAAGVADFRFHDLRHSYASFLANADVRLEVVGKLLGNHPLTTRRYAHLYEQTLRDAVKKLG